MNFHRIQAMVFHLVLKTSMPCRQKHVQRQSYAEPTPLLSIYLQHIDRSAWNHQCHIIPAQRAQVTFQVTPSSQAHSPKHRYKVDKKEDILVFEVLTFSEIKNILMAFKSGVIKSKTALKPLQIIVNKFASQVNLLLVKTPDYSDNDLIINKNLEKLINGLLL